MLFIPNINLKLQSIVTLQIPGCFTTKALLLEINAFFC